LFDREPGSVVEDEPLDGILPAGPVVVDGEVHQDVRVVLRLEDEPALLPESEVLARPRGRLETPPANARRPFEECAGNGD